MKTEIKAESPIYLSVKKLDKVLSIVSTKSVTSFTPSYFVNNSFSSSDAALAMASLRFLGLIDSESNSTPLMAKMKLKGETKTKALTEITKVAYKKLFDVDPDAHTLSKSDLHNDFVTTYEVSSRVVSGAVPAFIYLCEQAGLREAQTQPKTRKVSNSIPIKKTSARVEKNNPQISTMSGYTSIPIGENGIKLVLPADAMADIDLLEKLKGLISSISEFSEEYSGLKKKNEDNGTNSTER